MEKETIKLVKKMIEDGNLSQKIAEKYCPELKESEDERIRKELISFFTERAKHTEDSTFNGLSSKEIIAWLEKQGKNNMGISEATKQKLEDNLNKTLEKETPESLNEFLDEQGEQKPAEEYNITGISSKNAQGKLGEMIKNIKPADKVEPKFYEGDWIACEELSTGKIISLDDDRYEVEFIDGSKGFPHIDYIDRDFHLWTIQDAKDGDVLYSLDNNRPFIYKERNGYEQATAYCGLNIYGKFFIWGTKDCVITLSNCVPATKEQRDTLMKAMADAGYTFDFEKKELNKIEQKSAWSEEDKNVWLDIKSLIDSLLSDGGNSDYTTYELQKMWDWLDTIWQKDRVQPKQEWSEEDEKIRIKTIELLETADHPNILHRNGKALDFTENINWLKSLRPQKPLTNEEIEQAKKEYRDVALSKMDYIPEEFTYDDGWDDAISYMKSR